MPRFRFWLFHAVLRGFALLPWSWLHALGYLLGTAFWYCNTREKRITEINIGVCLPELNAAQRAQLVRASLIDFGKTAFEIPKLWLSPAAAVLAQIRMIEGEELLHAYRAQRRGVIMLAPHHGNWEVAGLYLAQHYGLTTMYLPAHNAAVDQLIRVCRSRTGSMLAPADSSGVRTVLKALKRGELIGILPDQVPKQAGAEFAPFFGQSALTMTLASNLLQKTGARGLITYSLRLPDGGFKLVFREPDPAIYSDDLAQSLAGLNRSVEACVRDHPEQYQWEYKRFKGPARSNQSIYK